MAAPLPAAVEDRRRFFLRAAFLALSSLGLVLIVLSAGLPWFRRGGTLLNPTCTDGDMGFVVIAAPLAGLALLGLLPNVRSTSVAAGVCSAGSLSLILFAAAFAAPRCTDCICAGGIGMAYGWLVGVSGAALCFSAALAGLVVLRR